MADYLNDTMSTPTIKVLLVEDNPGDVFLVKGMLLHSESSQPTAPQFSITTVDYLNKAITTLGQRTFDIVLLDLSLPDSNACETVATWNSYNLDIPVIILTGSDVRAMALQSLQQGVQDYLIKDQLNSEYIKRTIRYAIERHRITHRLEQQTIELKRANTQLEHKTTQLEFLNQEMASFAYSVSHELRNPLTVILGRIGLLQRKHSWSDEQIVKHLKAVETEGNRINQLIQDLMQLSGLNQETIQMQQVNLSAIAEMIFEQLKATQPERQVTVHIGKKMTVWGDYLLLWVVVENLLRNAWKYTQHKVPAYIDVGITTIADLPLPEQQALLNVIPEEFSQGAQSLYFVKDNGVGFKMEDREQLFSPFGRLHSRDEFDGNGLGLAIVQRIVHRHNGMICAIAAVGQGATFYFTLPDGDRVSALGE